MSAGLCGVKVSNMFAGVCVSEATSLCSSMCVC